MTDLIVTRSTNSVRIRPMSPIAKRWLTGMGAKPKPVNLGPIEASELLMSAEDDGLSVQEAN